MTLKKPSTSAFLLNKGAEGVLMYELQDAQVQPKAARKAAMNAMLKKMASADYQQALGEVEKAERRREVAKERLTRRRDTLEAAPALGNIKNLADAEAAVSVAKQELEEAEDSIRVMRGDCSESRLSPQSQKTAPSPSSVVTASGAAPDPERRLTLLRTLGGTAKYIHGEWRFTGISALEAREQADGRKRSTQKTIRADLKEAAQNERDANRAGFVTGLGQR